MHASQQKISTIYVEKRGIGKSSEVEEDSIRFEGLLHTSIIHQKVFQNVMIAKSKEDFEEHFFFFSEVNKKISMHENVIIKIKSG